MADIDFPVLNGVVKKLLDIGDGYHAEVVAIGGLEGDVVISGDAVVDTAALEALVGPVDATAEEIPQRRARPCLRCCGAFSRNLSRRTRR